MAERIPILVYHRIHLPEDVTVPQDGGRVDFPEFERQMDYLNEAGVHAITHAEIAAWLLGGLTLPDRVVCIDFDDNRLNVLENAFPIMEERGLKGTVWVITDMADGKSLPDLSLYAAMDWNHLSRLRDAGWCIAPHTRRHYFLAGNDNTPKIVGTAPVPRNERELIEELAGSRNAVEEHLGVKAPYFAYPGGSWNEKVEGHVKTVYDTARLWMYEKSSPWSVSTRKTNPYRLPGINVAGYLSFDAFRQIVDMAG